MENILGQIDLKDKLPFNISFRNENSFVEWCHTGSYRFTDPFFEDTIRRCLALPQNRINRLKTSIDVLNNFNEPETSNTPSGFIFHTSRCGSTLISQMLAALPQCIVISEAPPIDSVLRSGLSKSVSDDARIQWLRGIISVFGRKRFPEEKHLIIKFDSWHILDFELICRAFPDIPKIFLYRSPVEVLVSHKNKRGSFMVPGLIEPEWFGRTEKNLHDYSLEEFGARVLGRIYEAGLNNSNSGTLRIINYSQLPEIVWTELLDYFIINSSNSDLDKLKDESKYYSKNPGTKFKEDSKLKSSEASESVKQLAEKYIQPFYEKLETLRDLLYKKI